MKRGTGSLESVLAEIQRQSVAKKDLIVPARKMSLRTSKQAGCCLVTQLGSENCEFAMSDHACHQLAGRLDIPHAYFRRMREHYPELLDINVNRWLDRELSTLYLVRTLDDSVRAVLSNRYRRLDHFDLALHLVPVLQSLPGASFASVELTERRFYIKVICPSVACEIRPGDIVQAGVVISNSEVGAGATYVKPLLYRLICKNGLIAEDLKLQRQHTGRAIGEDTENAWIFTDETLQADDKAFFLRMRDMVHAAISEVSFALLSERLKKTLDIQLKGDPEAAVQVLSNKFTMDEAERKGVLLQLIAQRDMTGYGLINAVTEHSQQVADYDRATEFEEIGGKLLGLKPAEWRAIANAA